MKRARAALAAAVVIGCGISLAAQPPAFAAPPPTPAPVAPVAPAAVGGSLCAPPADTVAPLVTKVSFGRSAMALRPHAQFDTVRVSASDASGSGAPSGVAGLYVAIEGPGFFTTVKVHRVSGTAVSGTWAGRFSVSKFAKPGKYSIAYLQASDAARNVQYYYGGTAAQGPNSLSLTPAIDPVLTVTGTPATKPPRTPAGKLASFTVGPNQVDTAAAARRVRFVARFTGAAPRLVTLDLEPVNPTKRYVVLNARLHRHDGRWTGGVTIPRWLGKRQTLQTYLFAYFGAGHSPTTREFTPDRLQQFHFPNQVTVRSGVDKSKPTLTALSITPHPVDSSTGPVQLTITARAKDVGSGVSHIDVDGFIQDGVNGVSVGVYPHAAAGVGYLASSGFDVSLKHTAGGAWVGTTTIRECVPTGTYKLSVDVGDVGDNYRYYSSAKLATAHLRSTLYVASRHGDRVAPYVYGAATFGGQVFLNFSEGVRNVNTSTLTVFPLAPKAARFRTPATVTGIVCSDGTGTVDCSGSAGLVTSAKLTLASPKPGTTYDVYANLDQTMPQLVDGNRNPLDWNDEAAQVIDS